MPNSNQSRCYHMFAMAVLCCATTGCGMISSLTHGRSRDCEYCQSNGFASQSDLSHTHLSQTTESSLPGANDSKMAMQTPYASRPVGSSDDAFAPSCPQLLPIADADSCEAKLKIAEAEFDDRIKKLESKIDEDARMRGQLDRQLTAMNEQVRALQVQQAESQKEMQQIVQRIDEQHRSDMQSLAMISKLVEALADKQPAAQPASYVLPPAGQ